MAPRAFRSHLQLVVDFHQCRTRPQYLQHPSVIKRVLEDAVRRSGMTIVGRLVHQFEGQGRGVTAVFVVAESHLVVHTWPESSLVNLDVFFCNFTRNNERQARRLLKRLADLYRPRQIVRQTIRHRS